MRIKEIPPNTMSPDISIQAKTGRLMDISDIFIMHLTPPNPLFIKKRGKTISPPL